MRNRDLEKTFVYDSLLPRVLSPHTSKTWNLRDEFRNHITGKGEPEMRSLEIAEQRFPHLSEFLEQHFLYWDAQGVPRPLTVSDQDHIFLAWPHRNFLRYSGLVEAIDSNFCEMFMYLQGLDPKRFLVACSLWLNCVGFDRIFLCDGSGDEGVDVLAMFDSNGLHSGLRSSVAVVQVKKSSQPVSRKVVLAEYGKYQMLRKHGQVFLLS